MFSQRNVQFEFVTNVQLEISSIPITTTKL